MDLETSGVKDLRPPVETYDYVQEELLHELAIEEDNHAARVFLTKHLIRDGAQTMEPYEDTHLLRHLQGEAIQDIAAGLAERRRIAARAPAYCMEGNQLKRKLLDGTTRLVPRPDQRKTIVRQVHCGARHLGARRTLHLLMLKYHWQGMKRDVQAVLGVCVECKRRDTAFKAEDPELHSLPSPSPDVA